MMACKACEERRKLIVEAQRRHGIVRGTAKAVKQIVVKPIWPNRGIKRNG